MLHEGKRQAPLPHQGCYLREDASMRCKRISWAALGVAAFLAGETARADSQWPECFCRHHYTPYVTWYAPNSPYPYYFGPPYPETDYRTLTWVGTPQETAIAVKNQLVLMGIYPKEPLPPPKPGDKKPGESIPKPKEKGSGAEETPRGEGKTPKPAGKPVGTTILPNFLPKSGY
jgi:hypothetical protein